VNAPLAQFLALLRKDDEVVPSERTIKADNSPHDRDKQSWSSVLPINAPAI